MEGTPKNQPHINTPYNTWVFIGYISFRARVPSQGYQSFPYDIYLLYIGDEIRITQLYRDYNKPISGSLVTNQDSMECHKVGVFFHHCSCWHKVQDDIQDDSGPAADRLSLGGKFG